MRSCQNDRPTISQALGISNRCGRAQVIAGAPREQQPPSGLVDVPALRPLTVRDLEASIAATWRGGGGAIITCNRGVFFGEFEAKEVVDSHLNWLRAPDAIACPKIDDGIAMAHQSLVLSQRDSIGRAVVNNIGIASIVAVTAIAARATTQEVAV